MSEFVVHGIPGRPFGRAVLIVLEEKSAAYRFAPVAPAALNTPQHLGRHPFGRVPVLEHGNFLLYETQAILRYLDRVLPRPALTPAEPRAAARMDQMMNVNDWYVFNGVANVIAFQRIVALRVLGRTPDEAVIAAAVPRARSVIAALAAALGGQRHFAGDELSLADLLLAPQLDFMQQTPEWAPLAAGHANLQSWLDRMNARRSFAATTWTRVAALAQSAAAGALSVA
jgi:glutathione S-transferase